MKPEFTKGGRGKVAPYQTTHVRLPEAVKPFLETVISGYKQSIDNGTEDEYLGTLKLVNNNNKLEAMAKEVIKLRKSKKSTKQALDNLLTAILGDVNTL